MVEPASPAILGHQGLFSFSGEALGELTRFAIGDEPGRLPRSYLAELVALTAAEYALLPYLTEPRPVQGPVEVPIAAARLALLKANCASIEYCAGPLRRSLPTLSDITAFSGDVSKLHAVALLPYGLADEPLERWSSVSDAWAYAIGALEAAHRASPNALVREVAHSGVLRWQGFLWAAKALMLEIDVEGAIARAYDLLNPEPGPQVTGA